MQAAVEKALPGCHFLHIRLLKQLATDGLGAALTSLIFIEVEPRGLLPSTATIAFVTLSGKALDKPHNRGMSRDERINVLAGGIGDAGRLIGDAFRHSEYCKRLPNGNTSGNTRGMTQSADPVRLSPNSPLDDLVQDLADLERRGRARRLQARAGIDFSSNDYLGLARSPRLARAVTDAVERGVSVGSGGSRLLRGNDDEHEMLEAEAAAWFGCESALYFPTGYAANAALLATLPGRDDLIVHDTLVHASAHEGMRLGRAPAMAAGHNDPTRVDTVIAQWRASGGVGRPWIAIESLYSMDGDHAPLDDLAAVASRRDAVLLIDEAHATGVTGPGGRGLAAALEGRPDVITLRTCGKALGCEGALVCCPRIVRDFLVNRGRSFIFSTAPSPLMACAVRESLRILADEPERRVRLAALIATANRTFEPLGIASIRSQIVPIVIGDDRRTMRIAGDLQAAGFDVRGIRPPSVPDGTARLRVSLTLNVTAQDLEELAAVLERAMA